MNNTLTSWVKTTCEISQVVLPAYFQRANTIFAPENSSVWGQLSAEENKVLIENEPTLHNEE